MSSEDFRLGGRHDDWLQAMMVPASYLCIELFYEQMLAAIVSPRFPFPGFTTDAVVLAVQLNNS